MNAPIEPVFNVTKTLDVEEVSLVMINCETNFASI